jgi:serine/threonine protein kinase
MSIPVPPFEDDSAVQDILEVVGDMCLHILHIGMGGADQLRVVRSAGMDNVPPMNFLEIPHESEAILVLCHPQAMRAACPVLMRASKISSAPPLIAVLLRNASVCFQQSDIAQATSVWCAHGADSVIVQPSDRLDFPERLDAALSAVRVHWDKDKSILDSVDERANYLFFGSLDKMVKGFPKLNSAMEERQPSATTMGGVGRHVFAAAIGQGKFGTVYRTGGGPHGSNTPVEAVKVIPKWTFRSMRHVNQVMKECHLLQRVSHPNISGFRGLVHAKNNLYIFMEYVGPTDLSAVIRAGYQKRLESAHVLELFLQICDAVAFLHQSLVAHRDIKSENIVVTKEAIPKLVDFGLACPLSNPPQLCDDKCGTIPFAPPEVYRGAKFEATAMDVWSLGILTLEMRCGNNAVCHMLGARKAEPNAQLAEMVEKFFGHPDWPISVQAANPGVGMAEELICVLRGSLVITPELRWKAVDLFQHIANSSSMERITGRGTASEDYASGINTPRMSRRPDEDERILMDVDWYEYECDGNDRWPARAKKAPKARGQKWQGRGVAGNDAQMLSQR